MDELSTCQGGACIPVPTTPSTRGLPHDHPEHRYFELRATALLGFHQSCEKEPWFISHHEWRSACSLTVSLCKMVVVSDFSITRLLGKHLRAKLTWYYEHYRCDSILEKESWSLVRAREKMGQEQSAFRTLLWPGMFYKQTFVLMGDRTRLWVTTAEKTIQGGSRYGFQQARVSINSSIYFLIHLEPGIDTH